MLLIFGLLFLLCLVGFVFQRIVSPQVSQDASETRTVAFVHPDLGIGGAERLVVDAAVGLQTLGHKIVVYTSHHDPTHCFEETRNGLLKIKVFGDFFPRSIMGRFHILFATMRGVYLALAIVLTQQRYDVLFVDQLSSPIPILRLCGSRIIFYCHFPDLALSGRRDGLKRVYRVLFDAVEEWTTLMAHDILVNSHFTAGVFKSTFRNARGVSPQVLHPCINTAAYDTAPLVEQETELSRTVRGHVTLVSINRFERKKNIALALHAFGLLKDKMAQLHQGGGKGGCAGPAFGDVRLVIAGGYDGRVRENVEYMLELRALADRLGIKEQVVFLPSFSEEERGVLLRHAAGVVYTPHNEHFGIVPLEAMYAGRPVMACSSGGPLESIVHGITGWLCEGSAEAFAQAYLELVQSPERAAEMGRAGRQRVAERFSLPAFARRLSRLVSGPPGTLLDPPHASHD